MKKLLQVVIILAISMGFSFVDASISTLMADEIKSMNEEGRKIRRPPHLRYFGPAFTGVTGIGEKENYFEETANFSNLAMVSGETAEADIKIISSAGEQGLWVILCISHIFWEIIIDEDDEVIGVELYSDYLDRWLDYADQISAVEDKIIGFFILDELWWNAVRWGISFQKMGEMVDEVSFQIKNRFPRKKIVGSVAVTRRDLEQETIYGYTIPEDAKEYYCIPVNYDWVGIYYYWSGFKVDYPQGDFSLFAQIWEERMESFDYHLSWGQKILLVPGTFAFNNSFNEDTEEELIQLAPWYLNKAKKDRRIVGIMPFLWPSLDERIIGLDELPTLQEKWGEIGKKIILGR